MDRFVKIIKAFLIKAKAFIISNKTDIKSASVILLKWMWIAIAFIVLRSIVGLI